MGADVCFCVYDLLSLHLTAPGLSVQIFQACDCQNSGLRRAAAGNDGFNPGCVWTTSGRKIKNKNASQVTAPPGLLIGQKI